MEFKFGFANKGQTAESLLKVLSYWNLNIESDNDIFKYSKLKVLSYWNLNKAKGDDTDE